MFEMRLIRADALKLRHRRGMVAISVLLPVGIAAIVYGVQAIQHTPGRSRSSCRSSA